MGVGFWDGERKGVTQKVALSFPFAPGVPLHPSSLPLELRFFTPSGAHWVLWTLRQGGGLADACSPPASWASHGKLAWLWCPGYMPV